GSVDFSQLVDLGGADNLSESVAHKNRAWNFFLKEVASVRKDAGNSGADIISFDQGCVAQPDSSHIRDGVQWSGRQYADSNPQVACPGANLRLAQSKLTPDHGKNKDGRKLPFHTISLQQE